MITCPIPHTQLISIPMGIFMGITIPKTLTTVVGRTILDLMATKVYLGTGLLRYCLVLKSVTTSRLSVAD